MQHQRRIYFVSLALALVGIGCGSGGKGKIAGDDAATEVPSIDAGVVDVPPFSAPPVDGPSSSPDRPERAPAEAGVDAMVTTFVDAAAAVDVSSSGMVTVTPPTLIFSGPRGSKIASKSASITNAEASAVEISAVSVRGTDAAMFSLVMMPPLPLRIEAGTTAMIAASFSPAAGVALGAHRAAIHLEFSGGALPVDVALAGLATNGLYGENEPTLAQVLETLGYGVNVGGTARSLGTGPGAVGEEVLTPRFMRASSAPTLLRAIARYSPDEALPFGVYTGAVPTVVPKPLATIQKGQAQTLLPAIEPGAAGGDAGLVDLPVDVSFGVYAKSAAFSYFTEDALNRGPTKHAVRVFPLRDENKQVIANAFLLCFEEATNGDYQDFVFVLTNAKPSL